MGNKPYKNFMLNASFKLPFFLTNIFFYYNRKINFFSKIFQSIYFFIFDSLKNGSLWHQNGWTSTFFKFLLQKLMLSL